MSYTNDQRLKIERAMRVFSKITSHFWEAKYSGKLNYLTENIGTEDNPMMFKRQYPDLIVDENAGIRLEMTWPLSLYKGETKIAEYNGRLNPVTVNPGLNETEIDQLEEFTNSKKDEFNEWLERRYDPSEITRR